MKNLLFIFLVLPFTLKAQVPTLNADSTYRAKAAKFGTVVVDNVTYLPSLKTLAADSMLSTDAFGRVILKKVVAASGGSLQLYGKTFQVSNDSLFNCDEANILDYGAIGDSSTDNSLALKAAIATGKTIYIPRGYFNYSQSLILLEGQRIYGEGFKSRLRYTGTLRAINVSNRAKVENFRLTGSGRNSGNSNETGLFIANSLGWIINNMWIENFGGSSGENGGGGIYVVTSAPANSEGGTLSNVRASNNFTGLNFGARGEYNNITNVTLESNTYGISVGGGNNNFAGIVGNNNDIGLKTYNGVNNGHFNIAGLVMNHSLIRSLEIEDIATMGLGITFTGCHFYFGAISIKNAKNIRFSNCNISTSGITIDNSDFIQRVSCWISNEITGLAATTTLLNGGQPMTIIGDVSPNGVLQSTFLEMQKSDMVKLRGDISFLGQGEGAGKVWTSDATGKGSWATVSGASTPTLQQVTNVGAVTTNPIQANNFNVSVDGINEQASLGTPFVPGGTPVVGGGGGMLRLKDSQSNFIVEVTTNTFTEPRQLKIPNKDGTLVVLSDFNVVTISNSGTPADPASGTAVEWFDGTNKRWKKNVGGVVSTGILY